MAEYSLLVAAGKVKKARMNFAYIEGKKTTQVYISSRPAGSRVADLEEECGPHKVLFKGVCFKENTEFVFATKSAPTGTRETLITKVFKDKKANKFGAIVLRQLGADEPEGVTDADATGDTATTTAPGTTDEATPPAAGEAKLDEEGEYRKTKAEVAPKVAAAIKANPPNRDELLSKLGEALKMEKAGQYGNARELFFQLMAASSPPASNIPKAPPPPPKPAPPGVKAMSANELTVAMKNIVPRLQQAVAANPTRKAEIQALVLKFQTALRGGKLTDAQAAMMESVALVKEIAPTTPGAPPPPTAPPPPGATGPTAEPTTTGDTDDADADGAEDERAYNEAQDAAFTTRWGKASQVWFDCVEAVDGQIEKVRSAMQSSGDPEFEEIADKGMAALTNNHKTPVMVALREVNAARGEARAGAGKKARAAIDSFRNHIFSDMRIAACDDNCEAEFGVALNIREEIGRGLDELELALQELPAL